MKVGYCRVSTGDQHLDIQREQLEAEGCERIYAEKVSGKNINDRPELQAVLSFLRSGDVLVVPKLDRLARNLTDMLKIVSDLDARGVGVKSIAEKDVDTTSPAGRLVLNIFAVIAQFERERIRERQAEGIKRAKSKGIYKGRPPKIDADKIKEMRAAGIGPAEISRTLGCSESSVFRILNANGAQQNGH